jgi:hypothetical protein
MFNGRQGQLRDEYDDIEPFFVTTCTATTSLPNSEDSFLINSPHTKFGRMSPEDRLFHPDSLPEALRLPPTIARMATTELGRAEQYRNHYMDTLVKDIGLKLTGSRSGFSRQVLV